MVALQAQQPASPYLALWNRLADFDPAGLDAAFTGHAVVKATLMRLTLHAVHSEDHAVFREAMHPVIRASRLGPRFTASGLTAEDAEKLVPGLLEFAGRPRTTAECVAWLGERLGAPPEQGAWWGCVSSRRCSTRPPRAAVVVRPPASYIAPRTGPPRTDAEASAASLRALVLRYLSGSAPRRPRMSRSSRWSHGPGRGRRSRISAGSWTGWRGRRARTCSICRVLRGRTRRRLRRPG